MRIREEIHLINAAISSTLDLYCIWAKKHSINYNALLILYTMHEYGVCTQKQICMWWALPKQTVHGILVDFEKQGYIETKANEANKRERFISFTAAGEAFASSILKDLLEMEERAMEALGAERRKQLIECNTAYFTLLKEEIEHA